MNTAAVAEPDQHPSPDTAAAQQGDTEPATAEAWRQKVAELEARLAACDMDQQAMREDLEAFTASVSHDLRAPLRSIDGFSQALLEDYAERLDATAYLRSRTQEDGLRPAEW